MSFISKRRLASLASASALIATMAVASMPAATLAAKPADFDNQTGQVTKTIAETGFNAAGYNDNANIFVGTCLSWATDKGFADTQAYCGIYANDKLIMKWNAEWERGNAENWTDPNGYTGAWTSNEWNGMAGGSGSVWHSKYQWIGADGTLTGGTRIWGQFEVIMDHGIDNGAHVWYGKATSPGYGN